MRAAQAGDLWAVWGLLAATFSYGFVHAAGPGHGKIVLGGTALASGATWQRMLGLSLISALAQAATAIVMVGVLVGGLRVLGGADAVDVAERWLRPLSYVLIAGIGVLLVWRGARLLARAARSGGPAAMSAGHHHDHGHGKGDGSGDGQDSHNGCGHAHGPSAEDVARATGWRDAALLVASIAIRPCSGALFLLVIAAGLGLFWLGVLGTVAMGLGTGLFNAGVALSGVAARRLAAFGSSSGVQATAGVMQVFAGCAVLALSIAVLVA